jgi:uncharacterized protein YcfL
MKQIVMVAALGLACVGASLPAQAFEDDSIASHVEELGKLNNLRVTDLRAVKRDGLLRLQLTVSNSSPGNEQLYYRFRWLDADGFTVWAEEPWKPETIYGKQDKIINVVAPTFKATNFKLEVQSPNNSAVSGSSGGPASTADNPPYR